MILQAIMQDHNTAMDGQWALGALDLAERVRVTVFGDFALDVYWAVDPDESELNRMDFGGFNVPSDDSMEALTDALDSAAGRSDAIILNQQVPAGVSSEAMIERLNALVARHEDKVFVIDSRHRPGAYRGGILKMNSHEAASLAGELVDLSIAIPEARAIELARQACGRTGNPVFVTRGADGIIIAEPDGLLGHRLAAVGLAGLEADAQVHRIGGGRDLCGATQEHHERRDDEERFHRARIPRRADPSVALHRLGRSVPSSESEAEVPRHEAHETSDYGCEHAGMRLGLPRLRRGEEDRFARR